MGVLFSLALHMSVSREGQVHITSYSIPYLKTVQSLIVNNVDLHV